MTTFLTALFLAVVVEGLAYAAFPDQMKAMMARVQETPSTTIRMVALVCAAAGLALLWIVRVLG